MQLTKAEEQIMQILWEKGEGIVSEIRYTFNDPKPARNTGVSLEEVSPNSECLVVISIDIAKKAILVKLSGAGIGHGSFRLPPERSRPLAAAAA